MHLMQSFKYFNSFMFFMQIRDFVVHWNSKTESQDVLVERILYSLFVKRIKRNKPVIAAVIAKSGEGKSWGLNKLFEILMRIQGVDLQKNKEFFECACITNPLQYSEKMNLILKDKRYKKLNVVNVHEAKMLIDQGNWQAFINLAVADVNSMARKLKPLAMFYAAQYIKDIGSKVRPTLTHYITFSRPLKGNSRMRIEIVWNDEKDLEKPRLRKRAVSGFIVDEADNNSYQRFTPSYFEMTPPSKYLIDLFDRLDYEGKEIFLKSKLDKLMSSIKADLGNVSDRVNVLVDWYKESPDLVSSVARRGKRGWKLNQNFRKLHDLTIAEERLFQKKLNDSFKDGGFIKDEEGD